jgi:hypothetical protein
MQVQLTDPEEPADCSPNSGEPPERAVPANADYKSPERSLSWHPLLIDGKLKTPFKTLQLCSHVPTDLGTKPMFYPGLRSILEKTNAILALEPLVTNQ